jgi:hypothetical protein
LLQVGGAGNNSCQCYCQEQKFKQEVLGRVTVGQLLYQFFITDLLRGFFLPAQYPPKQGNDQRDSRQSDEVFDMLKTEIQIHYSVRSIIKPD